MDTVAIIKKIHQQYGDLVVGCCFKFLINSMSKLLFFGLNGEAVIGLRGFCFFWLFVVFFWFFVVAQVKYWNVFLHWICVLSIVLVRQVH